MEEKQGQEQEIDLIELVQKLWKQRVLILKITLGFMIIGLFVAIFSPKVYTASTIIVPQSSSSASLDMGGLAGLASLAGFNLGDMSSSGEMISPKLYPELLKNVKLQKELIYSKFRFENIEKEISFLEYYTSDEYNKPSVLGYIAKYTIGLPFVILDLFRGEENEEQALNSKFKNIKIEKLTKDEITAISVLNNSVTIKLNDKEGYLTIEANLAEPLFVAQMVSRTQEVLQEYITEIKIEKAKSDYEFILDQSKAAKLELDKTHAKYAKFRDANRALTSAVAKIKEEKLKDEYALANTMYTQMAQQQLKAGLLLEEDTPVFTVIKPVIVPDVRSKPQRAMIMMIYTFLGGIIGCGWVLGRRLLSKLKVLFLNN